MKRKQLIYFIRFYFWSIVFFIEGVYFLIRKPKPIIPISAEVNLLDDGEVAMMKKPSEAEAMANKAKLGMSALPKKNKKKIIAGAIAAVFFILFGIVNFIYWSAVIINKYNMVGWVLLDGILLYVSYLFFYSTYQYIKNKKYHTVLLAIQSVLFVAQRIWHEAKTKSTLKLQHQFI